ncbi:hypothetical protein K443DRAFT_282958 [Laccaria amethystina LaAM-08-1]|uniref:UDENN domain-containing protein n=1 Tax=Laccaria amethystina LaAM-08-1 TaxID=1095629 RepID=A0A0C9XK20_9AGAR|nr:hypothetical protein K443DRAFT_282958 [Laccaria amethystina LaAM-08-1]
MPQTLKLDEELLEEDIGTLTPYLSMASASSSRASSATIASTTAPQLPEDLDIHLMMHQNSERKQSFGRLASPSSPTLSLPSDVRPTQLSRSRTLPHGFRNIGKNPRKRQVEIEKLVVDEELVKKMQRWMLGIAAVEFDLEDGPVIDGIYPPLMLSPAERENIAFSAFPDSFQFDQGSQNHSFRIREELKGLANERRPPSVDGFIYGFAHFTQRRDSTSKRGYSQSSIVILTYYQYPALFSALASILGPLFQSHEIPMLESACHNIATWRNPTPGETQELGFLGTVLHVEIPHSVDTQQLTETSSFNEKYNPKHHILATTTPLLPPPLLLFEASLSNLWSIWECLVLCEPILIFGASPAQTSQAIWWLRDLLRPIPMAGDFRPYFTMQDGDLSLLVNKLPPKAGVILGVTNPFFEKSCAHWPHILSLGRRSIPMSAGFKTPSLDSSVGPAPGWKTRTHKRYISKDRVLLKQLEHACRGDDRGRLMASLALRRHFCSRTTQLITPLARYLNSLIPSPTEVSRARISTNILRLKPFNSANFFASLKAHGSTLPFKSTGKRTEFYERWLKSPAFGTWVAQQEQIVQDVLNIDEPLSTSVA